MHQWQLCGQTTTKQNRRIQCRKEGRAIIIVVVVGGAAEFTLAHEGHMELVLNHRKSICPRGHPAKRKSCSRIGIWWVDSIVDRTSVIATQWVDIGRVVKSREREGERLSLYYGIACIVYRLHPNNHLPLLFIASFNNTYILLQEKPTYTRYTMITTIITITITIIILKTTKRSYCGSRISSTMHLALPFRCLPDGVSFSRGSASCNDGVS